MLIKELKIIFENCDFVTIPGEYIGYFLVEDVRTRICGNRYNRIDELKIAHAFAVEISKEADKVYDQFGQSGPDNETTVFGRLQSCHDITRISFVLSEQNKASAEEKHFDFMVLWNGESDEENEAQKLYVNALGHLCVVVSDKYKTIEECRKI